MALFDPTSPLFMRVAALYQEWFNPSVEPPPVQPLADPTPWLSDKLREWEASVMKSRVPGAAGPHKTSLTFYAREHDTVEVVAELVFANGADNDTQWRAMMCSRADLPRSVARVLERHAAKTYLWPSVG